MKLFKTIWLSKSRPGTWIAIESHSLGHPFMFHFHWSGEYTQWFCYMNIFPIAISKNNGTFTIGLSFVKWFIGINFHLNFSISERKWKRKDLMCDFVPKALTI